MAVGVSNSYQDPLRVTTRAARAKTPRPATPGNHSLLLVSRAAARGLGQDAGSLLGGRVDLPVNRQTVSRQGRLQCLVGALVAGRGRGELQALAVHVLDEFLHGPPTLGEL